MKLFDIDQAMGSLDDKVYQEALAMSGSIDAAKPPRPDMPPRGDGKGAGKGAEKGA